MKDPEQLNEILAAVSDGAAVDWAGVEAQSAPADRQLLGQLRLLEQIASLHASLPPVPATERTADEAAAGPRLEPDPLDNETPAAWGSLTIVERIGRGTYADVYRAHDPRLDRAVALKLLRRPDAPGAGREAEVIEEARLLARIRHPHVVAVHGAERIDGRVGIEMELVDGRTLEQDLRDNGPFPAEELIAVGVALCAALGAVHRAGLLHRDVKAQNVLRDRDGRVVLTDLGSGRDVARTGAAAELTGTPLYLAPEIWRGESASVASDVYSLGVLLYHLGSGSFPVSGRSWPDVRDAHGRGARQPVQAARPDLPDRLASVIDRATAVDDRSRYQSAAALESALRRASVLGRVGRLPLAMVALLFTLAAGAVGYVASHRGGTAPVAVHAHDWVLVSAFDNRTGRAQFDGALDHALIRELGNSQYVKLVSPDRLEDALRLMGLPLTTVVDAAVGRSIALRDEDIHAVVSGEIDRIGTGYMITARVTQPQSGVVVTSGRVDAADAAQVVAALHRLSDGIRATLGEPFASIKSTGGSPNAISPSLEAVRLLSAAQAAERRMRWVEAETLLTAAQATDPQFGALYTWLALAQKNQGKPSDVYFKTAKRAVDLIASATERERSWILGEFYQTTGDNDRWLGEFEALVQRHPDDPRAIEQLAIAYRFSGRSQDADDQSARAAAVRPNDVLTNVEAFQDELRNQGLAAARPFMLRAGALLSAGLGATPLPAGIRTYVALDTAHEMWVQRRSEAASALVERIELSPQTEADGDAGHRIIGWVYLTLGQLRRAEQSFTRMKRSDQKAVPLAAVALARNDLDGVAAHLASYNGFDPVAVSLLVLAGDLPAAERQERRLLAGAPQYQQWAAAEIEEARGDRAALEAGLKEGAPWLRTASIRRVDLERGTTGGPIFLFTEALAHAAVNAGAGVSAIHVLEAAGRFGDRTYPWANHGGYFWMRTQKLLADLYRREGRIDDARVIERDLLAALAAADDDCPLLLDLRARAGK